jgi:biopolymer transport protein TolR
MGMSTGGGRKGLNSDINVTPMLDVLLVLLIVFMVTAPMMQNGVELTLPSANAPVIEVKEDGSLMLSVEKDGRLKLGETYVKWEELEDKLSASERLLQTGGELLFSADTHLEYGVVLKAMALARQSKRVSKLLMVTEPEAEDAPAAPPGGH